MTLIFLDTETTGTSLADEVWEIAAIRRNEETGLNEAELHLFIDHDLEKVKNLPEKFRADHDKRWGFPWSTSLRAAAEEIDEFIPVGSYIVGAVPNFDTERIALLLRKQGFEPHWHHRLRDVENLAAGHWGEFIGGLSDVADRYGIEHPEAHTAMGDVRTTMALYDRIIRPRAVTFLGAPEHLRAGVI